VTILIDFVDLLQVLARALLEFSDETHWVARNVTRLAQRAREWMPDGAWAAANRMLRWSKGCHILAEQEVII